MTGDAVDQIRYDLATEIEYFRAARMKRAAGGRIDRIGNLAGDRDACAA